MNTLEYSVSPLKKRIGVKRDLKVSRAHTFHRLIISLPDQFPSRGLKESKNSLFPRGFKPEMRKAFILKWLPKNSHSALFFKNRRSDSTEADTEENNVAYDSFTRCIKAFMVYTTHDLKPKRVCVAREDIYL